MQVSSLHGGIEAPGQNGFVRVLKRRIGFPKLVQYVFAGFEALIGAFRALLIDGNCSGSWQKGVALSSWI
jgi:hypothetical protein